ncbi:UNVERIFIED_ORG: NPCBM/NEW2 domain-containing protein [Zoogloea ramigera]|uniref:Alpha-galactosidase n=1 Tax=Duganella zoogloeoides TaxID=75659 RepID=A0ABZ0Y4C8_9BURK|nr:NPCBM/NEW2 domain-containing protein [Duganella zoogloeoides]WQH06912.1 NPCBM/NEW2 domain-containing protein [Duganella zoogloeoides]
MGTRAEREVGTYGYGAQDMQLLFGEWNFDYVKVDACGLADYAAGQRHVRDGTYRPLGPYIVRGRPEEAASDQVEALYADLAQQLAKVRPQGDYVLSICAWGEARVADWAGKYGNMWRTSADIRGTWSSMLHNFDSAAIRPLYAGPGRWNDPDMLKVGIGEFDGAHLVAARAHLSMWAIINAPLILGADLPRVPQTILDIMGNRDVIAINQDPAGHQGVTAARNGDTQVIVKTLAQPGRKAVALINRGDQPRSAAISVAQLNLDPTAPLTVRNAWTGRVLALDGQRIVTGLAPRETVLLVVEGRPRVAGGAYVTELPARLRILDDGSAALPMALRAQWVPVQANAAPSGAPLVVDGQPVNHGIGALVNSRLQVRLDAEFGRFRAQAGVMDVATLGAAPRRAAQRHLASVWRRQAAVPAGRRPRRYRRGRARCPPARVAGGSAAGYARRDRVGGRRGDAMTVRTEDGLDPAEQHPADRPVRRRTFVVAVASALAAGCTPLARRQHERPVVLGVIEYGQSNGEAQAMKAAAVLHPDYPAGLRMPQTASANVWLGQATVGGRSFAADAISGLAPLRGAMGSATHGTTAGESMVLRLVDGAAQPPGQPGREIVLFNAAEGGQAIRNLLPDAAAQYFGFRNLQRAVTAVTAALEHEHKRYEVRVVIMAQGESDARNRQLGALQEQVRAAIEVTVKAVTGQRVPVWLLTVQPSSFSTRETAGVLAILDQHGNSLAQRGAFFCLGPTYNFPFAHDFLHHTTTGHDMRGELYAVAYQALLRDGRWDPLRVLRATLAGPRRIVLDLSEAAAVEHIDAAAPPPWLGIDVVGGAIAAITVDGAAVVITTTGPAAQVTAVRVGLAGHDGKRSAATVPRTSIRSAFAYGIYRNGDVMRKWLCHASIELSPVESF